MLKAGKSSLHESIDDEITAEELLITEYVVIHWRVADLPEPKKKKKKNLTLHLPEAISYHSSTTKAGLCFYLPHRC